MTSKLPATRIGDASAPAGPTLSSQTPGSQTPGSQTPGSQTTGSQTTGSQTPAELLVDTPATPEPAPVLQGSEAVAPRQVQPQIVLTAKVGEFITEIEATASRSFGDVLDASLELTLD